MMYASACAEGKDAAKQKSRRQDATDDGGSGDDGDAPAVVGGARRGTG